MVPALVLVSCGSPGPKARTENPEGAPPVRVVEPARVERARAVLETAREAARARIEALRIAQDQFELGLAAQAARDEAAAQAAASEADALAAEYQVRVALIDLERLAGRR